MLTAEAREAFIENWGMDEGQYCCSALQVTKKMRSLTRD